MNKVNIKQDLYKTGHISNKIFMKRDLYKITRYKTIYKTRYNTIIIKQDIEHGIRDIVSM